MKALVLADELAKDVAGAEAIIQRHNERKEEIVAQDDSFKASSQFGQSLISSGHYESEQVKEIVSWEAPHAPLGSKFKSCGAPALPSEAKSASYNRLANLYFRWHKNN